MQLEAGKIHIRLSYNNKVPKSLFSRVIKANKFSLMRDLRNATLDMYDHNKFGDFRDVNMALDHSR